MKTVALMQPYLFPYLGYFQTIATVDEYMIYDNVQFIKGGWINRNNLLVGNNKVLFTVALTDASANKLINEITIADNFEKLTKTISMAYSKAPQKEPVLDLLKNIFAYPDKNLARFAGNSLIKIAEYLGIKTKIMYSSDVHVDESLSGQDRVLAYCKAIGGDAYINAIGGQELYSKTIFKDNGIDLKFIKMDDMSYKQFGKEFVPNLSIIDVLMFNEPAVVREMLGKYELV